MNRIELLTAEAIEAQAGDLGAILTDCVDGGAVVSFMEGLSAEQAENDFRAVAVDVREGRSFVLAASINGVVSGTVQVTLAAPPNAPHRAELSRLLVHRKARWRGLGRALVLGAEAEARNRGKTLLCLETMVGSLAERLFTGMAYRRLGIVPDHALHPNGLPVDSVFFWKPL